MVNNNWDLGLQEDYDNMTEELGTTVLVSPRDYSLGYDSFEEEQAQENLATEEIAFVQVMGAENEAVSSGILSVGDVKFTFKHNAKVEVDYFIKVGEEVYKIIELTKIAGMTNGVIVYIRGHGKKISGR